MTNLSLEAKALAYYAKAALTSQKSFTKFVSEAKVQKVVLREPQRPELAQPQNFRNSKQRKRHLNQIPIGNGDVYMCVSAARFGFLFEAMIRFLDSKKAYRE